MDYLRTTTLDSCTHAQRAHVERRGYVPVMLATIARRTVILVKDDGGQWYSIHRDGESFRVRFDGVSVSYAIPGFSGDYEEPRPLGSWAIII